jgi:hypothetical protein
MSIVDPKLIASMKGDPEETRVYKAHLISILRAQCHLLVTGVHPFSLDSLLNTYQECSEAGLINQPADAEEESYQVELNLEPYLNEIGGFWSNPMESEELHASHLHALDAFRLQIGNDDEYLGEALKLRKKAAIEFAQAVLRLTHPIHLP